MNTPVPGPRLRVVTREIDAIDDLLAHAAPQHPTVWSRRGDILVGVGSAARYRAPASAGAAAAAAWWRRVAHEAEVVDPLGIAGTGLAAFGALPFDARSATTATLEVPHTILGRRGDRCFVTRITDLDDDTTDEGPATDDDTTDGASRPIPFGPHWSASVGPGLLGPEGYQQAVRGALEAIEAGEVEKVVIARDLVGSVPPDADLRRLVRALASAYPDTWVYAVDGLIGASPETLVTVSGGTVTARVLAGTVARGADADTDTAASVALATSTKDLDEHGYAVRSVLDALRPFTSSLVAGEQPFMLALPNVWHLATDVEGDLSSQASALDLVGALHPTAAVAGTPTVAALDVIHRLEPFDRGRYAGPVGWIDAAGDGEWAIALRGAQFVPGGATASDDGAAAGIPFTAYAGAGIVAASDPETELLETRVKFRPIVDALA